MSAINPNDLKTSLNHVPITTVNDLSCVDSTVNKIATLNLNQDHQALLKEEEESKQPVQKSLIRENKPPFNIFSMWAQERIADIIEANKKILEDSEKFVDNPIFSSLISSIVPYLRPDSQEMLKLYKNWKELYDNNDRNMVEGLLKFQKKLFLNDKSTFT